MCIKVKLHRNIYIGENLTNMLVNFDEDIFLKEKKCKLMWRGGVLKLILQE